MVEGLRLLPPTSIHEALDSVFQVDDIEIDEQSERSAAEFEVGDDLSLMNGRDAVHGLDLYDNNILDQQVHSISNFEFYAAIDDGKPDLTRGSNTRFLQFVMQARLIGALE